MKNTLYATITANGYIADENRNEEIFSDENWDIFAKLAIEHNNIIWGRKTYEMVLNWGKEYIEIFDSIKIIVISRNGIKYNKNNVIVCNNINDAISILKKSGINTPFISGGSSIYTEFLKEDLIDKIILSYNSIFVYGGTNLFNKYFDVKKYKITKVNKVSDYIVNIEMER